MKVTAIVLLLLWQPLVLDRPRGPAAEQFRRATGFPNGRPGYVVDHIVPICAGGPDAVQNLQWQERQASYRKDAFERALCRALHTQHLILRPAP